MYDVITVGSSTIDVFALADSELIKITTAHHEEELIAYPLGTKLLIRKLDFLTGGGGVNTAVSFSRQGFRTGYLGKIGHGTNSKLIKKRLKSKGVVFLGSGSKEHHSGYSIILDSIEGERTILAYKGANNYLEYNNLNMKKLKTNCFYFSSMVGESFRTMEKLAEFAGKNKIKIAFNPSNYMAEKGPVYLKNILDNTEILILNKEEAELLSDTKKIVSMINGLTAKGPKHVVVTDGKHGAYTIEKSKLVHVSPREKKSEETTGAGDAFASTYVGCFMRKESTEDCLKLATINAGSVIQKRGANQGLMTFSEMKKAMKKKAPKIKIKKL